MNIKKFGGALSAVVVLATASGAALSQTKIKLEPLVTGINTPLAMVQPAGDARMFIIEQNGRIKILENGKLRPTPFLDIRSKIPALHHDFDERGLLGIAFHPNFKSNGKFYIAYSAHLDYGADLGQMLWYSHTNVVEEYTVIEGRPEHGRPELARAASMRCRGRSSTTTATGSASGRTASSTSRWATAATPTTGASATTPPPATGRT